MTPLIPTPHELRQLKAGTLRAFLRPMERPVKHACDMEFNGGEWFRCLVDQKYLDHENIPSWVSPFAPGDVIAWQEEWERVYANRSRIDHRQLTEGGFKWEKQPASTMPVELARYTSTVAECRPVELSELTMNAIENLGFCVAWDKPTPYVRVKKLFADDWQTNYKLPFAKSWAWWIDLKGTQ